MVILQFNKLIRNKWVWGVFAVAISAFFAFDFLIADIGGDSRRNPGEGVGNLADRAVEAAEFETFVQDARGIGNNRDEKSTPVEINKKAWQALAATRTAEACGLAVSDAQLAQELERIFGAQGGLDFNQYRMMLATQLGVTPERFEAFLRRQMLVRSGIEQTMLGSAVWTSPMELDQAIADVTDVFTVRVATFAEDKAAADKVKVDEAGLRKWYDANLKKLALPERIKVRLVKFDATDTNVLARMTVDGDSMLAYYDTIDENDERFSSVDTNGVRSVRAFDEIKGEIEKELRQIEAVSFFETNVSRRAYAALTEADKGKSRLDTIAAEDGLKVTESDWFALDGVAFEGFAVPYATVAPGARNFADEVAQIDPETEDFRYAIVSSEKAVWLVERSALSEAHTPTFEEAKDKIVDAATRDARADAFKASVEAVIAKGAEAVLATKDVSTNLTFSASDLARGAFPDQGAVVRAAMKLAKGGLSGFTPVGSDRAVVVFCEDRTAGDVSKTVFLRSQIRNEIAGPQFAALSESWPEWNLEHLGFETSAASSVVEESADVEVE